MTPSQLNAYLENLNSKQRTIFGRLVKLLGKRSSLSDYHASALAFMEMKSTNTVKRSDWMGPLCQALAGKGVRISTSLGYRLLKFVALFLGTRGASQVKKLDGKIPWDSMMRILHIKNKAKQDVILAMVATEDLSTRDVRKLISKKTPYRRSRGGNPPAKPEKHPIRALRNLVAFTSKWPAVFEAWLDHDDKLLKTATRFKSGKATDDFLEDLEGVALEVKNMAESAKKLSIQLASILRKLEGKRTQVKASPTRTT